MAFVSYGGMAGGLRAVEQLRQVFAELHATTVRDTVSFHMARAAFDAAGEPVDAAGAAAAAKTMLDQLAWWAVALRAPRRRRPTPPDAARPRSEGTRMSPRPRPTATRPTAASPPAADRSTTGAGGSSACSC